MYNDFNIYEISRNKKQKICSQIFFLAEMIVSIAAILTQIKKQLTQIIKKFIQIQHQLKILQNIMKRKFSDELSIFPSNTSTD